MAAAAAHAVKNNRKLHPKDGNASQVAISLHSKDGTVPILLHKCDQSVFIITNHGGGDQ